MDRMTDGPRAQALPFLALSLLLVSVATAYSFGLGGGFAFDDFPNIVSNTALHVHFDSGFAAWLAALFSSPSSDLQRPLAMATFALNHALTGLDPWWMKLTNIGIHLLNTCLAYGLARCLLRLPNVRSEDGPGHEWTALWIAAAWALNPINLMAVLFVVQRMESLSHTFVFAGLWLYAAGRARQLAGQRGWRSVLAGLAGGVVLGLGAKESAILLPLYAFALEWAVLDFHTDGSGARDRRLLAGYAVLALSGLVALAWMLARVLQPDAWSNRDFTLADRLLTEPRVLLDYLHWTVLPNLSQLSLYHDDYLVSRGLLSPPSTLAAAILLGVLAFGAFLLRRRRPLMALGLAWFLLAHLLTATIVPLELVYEHRNYFASFGLCLALADALLRWLPAHSARRPGAWLACALLVLYGASTAARAYEWRDPWHFSKTEVAKHPASPRATYDLARTQIILSGYQPDSPYLGPARTALEQAMAAPGATILPEAAAIVFASRTRQPVDPRWWSSLQSKLRAHPIGTQETSALSALVDCSIKGQCAPFLGEMQQSFEAALSHGENAEVLNIAGNYALNIRHDPQEAVRLWRRTVELSPRTVEYQATMARMLIAMGQPRAAQPYIDQVRRLGRLGQTRSLADELDTLARGEQPSGAGKHDR